MYTSKTLSSSFSHEWTESAQLLAEICPQRMDHPVQLWWSELPDCITFVYGSFTTKPDNNNWSISACKQRPLTRSHIWPAARLSPGRCTYAEFYQCWHQLSLPTAKDATCQSTWTSDLSAMAANIELQCVSSLSGDRATRKTLLQSCCKMIWIVHRSASCHQCWSCIWFSEETGQHQHVAQTCHEPVW